MLSEPYSTRQRGYRDASENRGKSGLSPLPTLTEVDMSLVYCPECGHEISQNAIACPNCGLPLSARPPAVERVHEHVAPAAVVTRTRTEGIPPWAIAAFGLMLILGGVIVLMVFRGSGDDANVNLSVNANRRQAELTRDT